FAAHCQFVVEKAAKRDGHMPALLSKPGNAAIEVEHGTGLIEGINAAPGWRATIIRRGHDKRQNSIAVLCGRLLKRVAWRGGYVHIWCKPGLAGCRVTGLNPLFGTLSDEQCRADQQTNRYQ